MQNGIPLTDEMQLQLAERYGGIEAWGGPMMDPHYSAAWAWAGNTPFQWGKQVGSHLGGTRNPMVVHWPDADHRRRRPALAVHARDRRRADDPRRRRHPGARRTVDGIEQEPMHGVDLRRLADRRRRARAPHPAVLRDDRQPGHVQGRLVAGDAAPRASRGCSRPRRCKPYAPGRLGPRRRPGRAVLPARRLHPGPRPRRRAPREGRGAQGAVLGRRPRGTRCCRCWPRSSAFFGIAAAAARRSPSSSSAATSRTSLPGMIPRIYNHSYTISADLVIPDGRRRRRDRRRGRPPRRVLAVRRGRQADPHLLDDGRLRLPPAGRRAAADRRGDRAHGVRRRRGQAGHRRRGHAVHQRRSRSARAGWTTRSRSGSPATPAWTSAATTAAWSTCSYDDRQAVRVHRHDQEGRLRRQAASPGRGRASLHAVAHHGHAAHALSA